MKYYSLIVTRKKNILGEYPQVKSDTKPFEWLLPPLNHKIRYDNFLNFKSYFDITLNDNAVFTDIIERASLSWGLVVNDKFKSIVSTLDIPEHRFYPIKVLKENLFRQYYWFHFYEDIFKYIDLELSTFDVFNTANFEVLETLSVKSESFIREKQNKFGFDKGLRLRKIVFKSTFPRYDIWLNNIWGFETIISEKLKNKLKENGISGYETFDCKYI